MWKRMKFKKLFYLIITKHSGIRIFPKKKIQDNQLYKHYKTDEMKLISQGDYLRLTATWPWLHSFSSINVCWREVNLTLDMLHWR